MSSFDGSGRRARLQLDDIGAGLVDSPIDRVRPNEFAVLRNALPKPPGFLRGRGPISMLDGVAWYNPNNRVMQGWDVFRQDTKNASDPVQPYVFACGVSGAAGVSIAYASGNAGGAMTETTLLAAVTQTVGTPTDSYGGIGRGAMFSDRLDLPCAALGSNNQLTPGILTQTRGFTVPVQGGNVAVVNGSTAIVGTGTAFTAAMVGRWFVVRDETTATQQLYKIATYTDATHITLAQAYKGPSNASVNYSITEQSYAFGDQTVWADGKVRALAVLNAWSRRLAFNIAEADSGTVSKWLPTTLRWSGIENSSEGSLVGYGVGQGIDGWHPSGKLILPGDIGHGRALAKVNNAVVAMGTRGMCVLYGQPAFDTPAGVNFETMYDIGVSGPESFVVTPFGLFVFDRLKGLHLWDGSGAPQPVSDPKLRAVIARLMGAQTAATVLDLGVHLGYHREHVFMCDTRTGAALMLHVPSGNWTQLTGRATTQMNFMRRGRQRTTTTGAVDNALIGIAYRSGGARVATVNSAGNDTAMLVNVSDVVDNPGSAAFDWDGASPITVAAKSGRVGNRRKRMHTRKWFLQGAVVAPTASTQQTVTGAQMVVHGGTAGMSKGVQVGGATALWTEDGTGSLGNYTASLGAIGNWSYASGQLRMTLADNSYQAVIRTGRVQEDSYIRARVGALSAGTGYKAGVFAKYQSAANAGIALWIDAYSAFSGGAGKTNPQLCLGYFLAGSPAVFSFPQGPNGGTVGAATGLVGGAYAPLGPYQNLTDVLTSSQLWLVLRTVGNVAIGQLFDEDPLAGGVPVVTLFGDMTLVPNDATYGVGKSGPGGVFAMMAVGSTAVSFDDVWCGTVPLVGGAGSNREPIETHGYVQSQREPLVGVSIYNDMPASVVNFDEVMVECVVASEGNTT